MTDVVTPNLVFPALHMPAPKVRGGWSRGLRENEFDWTEERISTLKAMYADGASQKEIAEALGTTRGGVAGKLSRLGLSREQPTRAARAAVRHPRVAPETVVLPEGRLTFEELTDDVCHFPVGDELPFLFCGAPTTIAPYCASCAAISYRGSNHYREQRTFLMPI